MGSNMILALAIFAITVVLIILRPGPLNEGTAAAMGAATILITGVISLNDACDVFRDTANILLFFVGLAWDRTSPSWDRCRQCCGWRCCGSGGWTCGRRSTSG